MIKIMRKTSFALMMLVAMVLTTVNMYATVIDKGQGQSLILNQTLGIAGTRSVVEVFGTKGGGTVSCTSESTYSRAYTAYPEDGWVFVGWATYFDGVLSEGSNSTIGLGDDWLFSKVGDKETEYNQYATTIQANFELNVDLKIYAVFKPTIKVSTGSNGYATGNEVATVNYGGSYNVKFVPNTGYEISGITVDLYNSVSLTDADRAGYTYTFTNVTTKHTIYADFRPITYKVAYEGNGSTSGSMNVQELSYGTAQKLNTNIFKKTGYTFAGWNTLANGQGTSYTDAQEVNKLTTEKGKTITLYAQWVPATLTGTVEISGEKIMGKTLTASVTNTNNTGNLSYKWQRDGVNITDVTNTTYTLTEQDVGKTLKVIVTSSVQTGSISGIVSDITDKFNVEYALTNITTNGEAQATYLTDYVTTLLSIAEYKLPQTISVAVDGVELTSDRYTYDITLAKLTIPAASVTGNIKITAEAVAMEKYTVTIQEPEHVTITPSGVISDVLESSNVDIEIKAEKGYEIKSVKVNGVEKKLPLLDDILTLSNINENVKVVVEATKKTSNPQTGDNILIYVSVFVVAIIGAIVTVKLRKGIIGK